MNDATTLVPLFEQDRVPKNPNASKSVSLACIFPQYHQRTEDRKSDFHIRVEIIKTRDGDGGPWHFSLTALRILDYRPSLTIAASDIV